MPDPRSSSAPTFLFGIGTQKAGTSWLYDYLTAHPQTAMGPVKELHFFNLYCDPDRHPGLAILRLQQLREVTRTQIERTRKHKQLRHAENFVGLMDALAMQFEPARYRAYFERIRAAAPEARLIGEITPNYAALEAEDFRFARTEIESMDVVPRVVFLMREPVERCYSQLRMADREKIRAGTEPKPTARKRLLKSATSRRVEKLTRYERTVAALEQVFAPEEIFYGLYEDLFRDEEVRRLCAFLGIDYVDADFGARSNASPRHEEPDPEDVARIRDFYADTYAFCRERFGAERIDRLWGADAAVAR